MSKKKNLAQDIAPALHTDNEPTEPLGKKLIAEGKMKKASKAKATPIETPEPATPTKVSRKRATPAVETAPEPADDASEVCVFAFRLLRSERDELHAATGSAKASRFVKAIVLAGARGDMKAVQTIVDEIHAVKQ